MNGDQRKERPRGRFATVDEGGGDLIKCSGKYCRSCCGGYVADCVAVCCCPCAVLHCFALALLKGPCVVGRKCLGRKKKNKNKKNKKLNNKGHHHHHHHHHHDHGDDLVVETNMNMCAQGNGASVCDSLGKMDTAFDADKVWRELYQIRHLDFGRVSSSHDD